MSNITYKDLYTLVIEQILEKLQYPDSSRSDQLNRDTQAPSGLNVPYASNVDTISLINAVYNLMLDVMPQRIISGLTVKSDGSYSNRIVIKAGMGTVGGRLYELLEDTTIAVDLLSGVEVLYVNLLEDKLQIDPSTDKKKLTLAKIIIPQPGVTQYIVDQKEDSPNAYIQNFRTYNLYGDENGNFEEDTIEMLRQNISPILADNLIGNIRLNEDLKIINNAGTLELNSDEMRLKDLDGNTLAKFNQRGTFFYDTNNIEMARFTKEDARIGNILINKNSIQSGDYISENRGFKIQDNGFAEFEDVRVRGRISSSVFEYDKISAVGGKLLVSNSSVLNLNVSSTDTTITTEDSVFSDGEIIRIKDGINEEYMEIIDSSDAPTYDVIRNINSNPAIPTWSKGTAIVSTGKNISGEQTGFILLDAVSNYSPFIDINLRDSSVYNDWTTKVRIGNLEGITDLDFGGSLLGYGLYATNVYLKGTLFAPTIKSANSGYRLDLTPSGIIVYDDLDNEVFKINLSGIDSGDVIIGDKLTNNYVQWDESLGVLYVRGSLNATDLTAGTINADRIAVGSITANKLSVTQLSAITADLGSITAGTITGATIRTAITGSRIFMDTNNFIAYDTLSNEVFKILLSGVDVGDITIGDFIGNKGMMWDNSLATFTIRGTLYGQDIVANTITETQINSNAITENKINNLAVTEGKIASSAVSQSKLKTATGSVSVLIGAGSIPSGADLTLPGGEYGFYPQLACDRMDNPAVISATIASGISIGGFTYTTNIYIGGYGGGNDPIPRAYAKQRYVTASGKDHWIFLLVDKINKKIIASYEAPDHPCYGTSGDENSVPHPFPGYDKTKCEVILIDNEIILKIKNKINNKKSLLNIINEEYEIDVNNNPKYEEREIIEIDEYGDKSGEIIKEMDTPDWAKIKIQTDKIQLKRRLVKTLPSEIKYKQLKKKNK